ncbi:MAG: hypothetical protein AAGJ46_10970 [Planctomycetota bacterium]
MVRQRDHRRARRAEARRAFSLAEMFAALFLIGLLAAMAAPRVGFTALESADSEGFVRRLALDLAQSRRRAIANGDDHYLQFTRDSGVVASYAVFRDGASGDTQVDETVTVPGGSTVTTSTDVWTYDFSGALTTSGTSSVIRVDGVHFYWLLTVYHATGSTTVDKVAQP